MFDGVLTSDAGLPPTALDRPSLHALAYVLRHREAWPAGFAWAFGDCATCAMGLSYRLWHERGPGAAAWFGGVADLLQIPARDSFALFVDPGLWSVHRLVADRSHITPGMVADEVDHYRAQHPEVA